MQLPHETFAPIHVEQNVAMHTSPVASHQPGT